MKTNRFSLSVIFLVVRRGLLLLLLLPSCSFAGEGDTLTLTLPQAIEIAKKQSPSARSARHTFLAQYWNYRLEMLAERKFEKLTEHVVRGAGIYSGAELDWTDAGREVLDIPKGSFDELIVCKITGEKGERLQILAREGDQLMEMKYKGNVEAEKILTEISRVFASQTE